MLDYWFGKYLFILQYILYYHYVYKHTMHGATFCTLHTGKPCNFALKTTRKIFKNPSVPCKFTLHNKKLILIIKAHISSKYKNTYHQWYRKRSLKNNFKYFLLICLNEIFRSHTQSISRHDLLALRKDFFVKRLTTLSNLNLICHKTDIF
jgi:hypothetical protein